MGVVQTALAAGASLVALAFALSTFERWLTRRRPHELVWSMALGLFAAASVSLWLGAAAGWSVPLFRVFYLLGAIVDVPVLALGTVLLLGSERAGRRAAIAVVVFTAFSAGVMAAAPASAVPSHRLPQGSEVFGALPRALAALGSGLGATVVVVGALWSAWRYRGRLAVANGLIAGGTVVLGAGGLLNSTVGEMEAFAISLVVGITAIFAGFLVSVTPAARPAVLDEAPFPPVRAGAHPRS